MRHATPPPQRFFNIGRGGPLARMLWACAGRLPAARSLDNGILAALVLLAASPAALASKCLYVSSYHQGYEWNDGIEKGIESVLAGKCTIDKFYLDTKRHKEPAFAKKMARRAKRYIEATQPDVVIACDDNASRYLVMPYYRDAALPFVFCGINRSAAEYGYPYRNVTGMLEISPIKALLKEVKSTIAGVKEGIFLGSDVLSAYKEFELNREVYAREGIQLTPLWVSSMQEWETAYTQAQASDFVIISSNGGINDWDNQRAHGFALAHARTFMVTYYDFMAPYAVFAMTKLAEEQGEWAAKVALAILDGQRPQDIPIVHNRRWNLYVNPALLKKTGITLPTYLMHKAIKVE